MVNSPNQLPASTREEEPSAFSLPIHSSLASGEICILRVVLAIHAWVICDRESCESA